MDKIGQIYRLGIWAVTPENADEFVEAWQTCSDWLVQHLPDERGSILLEDTNDPSRFISFAPVSDPNKVEEVMARAEFREIWSKAMELCDNLTPNTMCVVGSVGS